MTLTITPQKSLVDEIVHWLVTGLEPGEKITVALKDLELAMESAAVFTADDQGQVDPAQIKPVEGSYDWLDPMGLFWTLKRTADSPMFTPFREAPYLLEMTVKTDDGRILHTKRFEKAWLDEDVTRHDIHEEGLHGVFFMPAGEGPFPGMMILTGSGGGVNERTAALWANHGVAAFTLAYFRYEGRPDGLVEIPLEYFEKGFKWMAGNPRIDSDRLGVGGGSRGGELSLLLASTFPFIEAVVAYVPSSVCWGGFSSEGADDGAAWTYQGKLIPYMHENNFWEEEELKEKYGDGAIPLTPGFLKMMEDEEAAQAAVIPVEKIKGAVLMISGEDDQMWPSSMFSEQVMARLKAHSFKQPYQHLSYPKAGHAILVPYLPLAPSDMIHPVDGQLYAFGGEPEHQAFATQDSWQKALAFVSQNL